MGANQADEDADPLVDESGMSWNQRRATALAQGLPEPQFDEHPPTPAEVAGMQRLMGGIDPILPKGVVPPA